MAKPSDQTEASPVGEAYAKRPEHLGRTANSPAEAAVLNLACSERYSDEIT